VPVGALAWRGGEASQLVTLGADVRVWQPPARPAADRLVATGGISALALSHDGRRVALADGRGAVSVFELASGARRALLPGDDRAVAKDLSFLHGAATSLVVIWPGAYRVATWDLARDAPPVAWPSAINLRRVVARADGKVEAATYGERVVTLSATGEEVAARVVAGGVEDVVASADGRVVADLSGRGEVGVRGAGVAERTFSAPGATALALDPSGATLAVATGDALTRLSTTTGAALARADLTALSPTPRVAALALSADGRMAAGAVDGRVLVWDAAGALVLVGRAHDQRVADLAFTPDGQELVSASWDGTALVWRLASLAASPEALLHDLEAMHGVGLDHALGAELR